MYCEVTQGIKVEVEPKYEPEQSDPEKAQFVFSYHVKITNESAPTARLMNRHWIITDGFGRVHEVKGPGVIGEQPVLAPGESFEYSSFCPLPTPTGNMRGTYEMVDEEKRSYSVRIPLFFLRDLRTVH